MSAAGRCDRKAVEFRARPEVLYRIVRRVTFDQALPLANPT